MKYWTGMLILLIVLLASAYASADVAPPPRYFWESECNTHRGFNVKDCVFNCQRHAVNDMHCLYIQDDNSYYIYNMDEITPDDIRVVTSQCQYFEQFVKKFPTSLKILNAAVKRMKMHQDCSDIDDYRRGFCEQCINTDLSTYCFFAGYKERCILRCHETQMCIDNYINRNVFW